MGANASTAVPLYASGQVLDAARLNLTNSGIPVFSGTATRNAAFGGSGEKVLAEGQFAYLEDTNAVQYYDGAAFQAVGASSGLTLVKSQVIGTTVSTVTVTNAFSATYNTYKIVINGGVGSTSENLLLTLGATVADYKTQILFDDFAGTPRAIGTSVGVTFRNAGTHNTTSLNLNLELDNPFLAEQTAMRTFWVNSGGAGLAVGILDNTTSYTDFTIAPTTGTITGGTIFVYGYAIS